jgi:hypothetical protein
MTNNSAGEAKRAVVLALATLVSSIIQIPIGHAATLRENSAGNLLEIAGDITENDIDAFGAKTQALPKLRTIALLSNGGNIYAAIKIGEFIHQNGWRTYVQNGCYSACALIWLAGAERRMRAGAVIGFHAASQDDGRESGPANAIVGAYLTRLGYSYDLIAFATAASPTDMAVLTPDKAKSLGVNMVVTAPPPAQPPASPSAQPPATTPAIAQQRSQDDFARTAMEIALAAVLGKYPGATDKGTGGELKVTSKVFSYVVPKGERPALCILIPTQPKGELKPACARLSLEILGSK